MVDVRQQACVSQELPVDSVKTTSYQNLYVIITQSSMAAILEQAFCLCRLISVAMQHFSSVISPLERYH